MKILTEYEISKLVTGIMSHVRFRIVDVKTIRGLYPVHILNVEVNRYDGTPVDVEFVGEYLSVHTKSLAKNEVRQACEDTLSAILIKRYQDLQVTKVYSGMLI